MEEVFGVFTHLVFFNNIHYYAKRALSIHHYTKMGRNLNHCELLCKIVQLAYKKELCSYKKSFGPEDVEVFLQVSAACHMNFYDSPVLVHVLSLKVHS